MAVLTDTTGKSKDVLKVEHRFSEPFDIQIDPAELPTIAFEVGQVAAIDATGFVGVYDGTAVPTPIGLFMLPSDPEDARKNDYVEASGNASVFTSGIVILNTSIVDATVAANAKLYCDANGQVTTTAGTSSQIGIALTARSAAGEDVRVKLSL